MDQRGAVQLKLAASYEGGSGDHRWSETFESGVQEELPEGETRKQEVKVLVSKHLMMLKQMYLF